MRAATVASWVAVTIARSQPVAPRRV